MQVTLNEDRAATIALERQVTLANAAGLTDQVLSLIDQGYRQVILDFSQVEEIDSSGLGKLLLLQKRLKECNGQLRLANVTSSYVRKMFDLIQLHKVISIE